MLYKQIINDSTMPEKVCSSEVLHSIVVKLGNKKNCIQNQHTAVSWMQYMGMVDVLRKVIKSERTANSSGCLRHAVILFAAAVHNLYAKSSYIYLKMTLDLQTKHQEVYKSFKMAYTLCAIVTATWLGFLPT